MQCCIVTSEVRNLEPNIRLSLGGKKRSEFKYTLKDNSAYCTSLLTHTSIFLIWPLIQDNNKQKL